MEQFKQHEIAYVEKKFPEKRDHFEKHGPCSTAHDFFVLT
jgi:hypothetical protein